VPCIWLDDQAEEAAHLYTSLFDDAGITAVTRYPESMDNPGGKPRGSVLTVELELAGQPFTALNGGPQFVLNPTISLFVFVATPGEVDRLFAGLAEAGAVMMPLDEYPWSSRYAWVQDRFGVSWQLMLESQRRATTIAPCLMFSGTVHGRAEEAIERYCEIFPGGRIDTLARYQAEEGPEGTIKHGRFLLGGQEMIAMDSHVDHGVSFNEALSLQVVCRDQQEIDHYWEALSEGGEKGPCGWLRDRFGVSWQVSAEDFAELLTSEDTAARDRAFAAMLGMTKLDIASIRAAFDGA
jgi:predicted 3-demethylubiquinone-9 3-methyltransferase (glyoxalase superfamily)